MRFVYKGVRMSENNIDKEKYMYFSVNVKEKDEVKATITLLSKHKLNALDDILFNDYTMTKYQKIQNFIDLYITCEILAMRILNYYYILEKHKEYKHLSKDGKRWIINNLDVGELRKATEYFNVNISYDELKKVFSSKRIDKKNTARILRNKYIHTRSVNISRYIINNYGVLYLNMEAWVEAIKKKLTENKQIAGVNK